jgi:hypothetical protein
MKLQNLIHMLIGIVCIDTRNSDLVYEQQRSCDRGFWPKSPWRVELGRSLITLLRRADFSIASVEGRSCTQ